MFITVVAVPGDAVLSSLFLPFGFDLYTLPPSQLQFGGLADTAARGNFDEREAVEVLEGLVSFISTFVLLGGTMYIYYRANPAGAGQRTTMPAAARADEDGGAATAHC
ncbi:hypothetical protein T492DRAFT_854386 [Pavlovales sp. CCMP2436]|nr:hypothetical protein T492DRAFT_854386 [Pavlovales sp. CCMP2436]